MPSFVSTIRFRLSLAFAVTVFGVGAFLIGGIYLYQVNRLDEPTLQTNPIVFYDTRTDRWVETDFRLVYVQDSQMAVLDFVEQEAYRVALNQLRRASFGALLALFAASFGSGWLLSGWALRPVGRINAALREISADDLSKRISMPGPDDELKSVADAVDGTLDRLQSAFEEQRRFVHEASHELRNPLAVASTNLELALDSNSETELRRAAEIAFASTGRMSALVEGLLDQARDGVPDVHRGPVDMRQMVDELAVEFTAAAARRRLSITVAETSEVDVVLQGDEPALRRAVSNLLANATRLAPEGSTITMGVHVEGQAALVEVADEGPGIAAEDQPRVFERFWRGDAEGAGTGLGLSIVRRIVERHGGSVDLESEQGAGSVFTLRLPLPSANSSDAGPAHAVPVDSL